MKKIPMRMCVACREMKPKKDLIRIVRTPEGPVEADLTGKRNGRGAYLCKNMECLEKAVKIRALDRALEVKLDGEALDSIREIIGRG